MDDAALQNRLDAIERRQFRIVSLLLVGYVLAGTWLVVDEFAAVTVWDATVALVVLALVLSIGWLYRRRQSSRYLTRLSWGSALRSLPGERCKMVAARACRATARPPESGTGRPAQSIRRRSRRFSGFALPHESVFFAHVFAASGAMRASARSTPAAQKSSLRRASRQPSGLSR